MSHCKAARELRSLLALTDSQVTKVRIDYLFQLSQTKSPRTWVVHGFPVYPQKTKASSYSQDVHRKTGPHLTYKLGAKAPQSSGLPPPQLQLSTVFCLLVHDPFFFLLLLGSFSGLPQHICEVEFPSLFSAVLIKTEEYYRNNSISRLSSKNRFIRHSCYCKLSNVGNLFWLTRFAGPFHSRSAFLGLHVTID